MLNPVLAQVAAPAPSTPDTPPPKAVTPVPAARTAASDEVVELSPFVVDASRDEGYQATATLAGSRINTDLRDVPQSITVLTKAFMTDTAAVGINDFLAYAANTEGSRDFTSQTSSLGRPTDDIAANPTTANRIRGLSAADITRDYFYTIGTWAGFDSYNLDEVTIVRGPNSVLAGLGSPAGIINYSPQLAKLSGDSNELSFRVGSYGDRRFTLNSNYVAIPNVLALRVAASDSDEGFEQKPSFHKDKRVYGTVTYKPWQKTTIRASYEWVKVNANNPNSLTPEDDITQWMQVGKPIYDSTSASPVSPFLTQNGTIAPTAINDATGKSQGAYLSTNVLNYLYFQQNLSNVALFTSPARMANDTYFNLHDVNLSPSLQNLRQKTFQFSVDQQILPGLYANVAYVNEKVNNDFLNLFRTEYSVYSVDVNKYLANGAANPHFMETYMLFRGLDNKQDDENSNEVVRGSVTYDLNLNKVNKWLGHYRLTGFLEDRDTDFEHLQYNARVTGDDSYESIGYLYYLGGTPGNGFKAQTVPTQPALPEGMPYSVYNPSTGTFQQSSLDTYYGLKSDSLHEVKLTTAAVVLQGYLWDDRIVGMLGIRRDRDKEGYSSTAGASGGSPDASLASRDVAFGTPVSKTTKTYGVVVHPLKWLSFHYNHSENFIPNAGSVDLLGNTTASPTGLTKEYGFSLNLIDDKLYAKVNWFKTTAANASSASANFPLAQWTIPYLELTFMPDLARQAGITYQPLMAAGLITGDPRLANAYTSETVAKGMEIEVTYNVTKNWRVMASVSKQEAEETDIAPGLTAFIENRLAYWQSIPALWSGPYVGQNVGWGVGRTGQQQWAGDNLPYYLAYKSAEGQPSTQLAKWHASAITNYEFTSGRFKGVNFGGGVRYIEKAVIGTPAITDSTGTVVGLDIAHPYYSPEYFPIDAWLGYKMKLEGGKYQLSFQLNVRDLESGGGYRPIVANSDGTHTAFRIVPPRTFYLTTTLDF
ncbi:MAG TPA: TonB-dependent receptor plug domain-containing protein [Candidatus Didemnitutus sp.]